MQNTQKASSRISSRAKLGQHLRIYDDVIIMDESKSVTIASSSQARSFMKTSNWRQLLCWCSMHFGRRLAAYKSDANYVNPDTIIGENSTIRSGTIIYPAAVSAWLSNRHRACIRENSIFGESCSFGTMSQSDGDITVGDNCAFTTTSLSQLTQRLKIMSISIRCLAL